MQNKVVIVGAGKIGCTIAYLFAKSQAYEVHLLDLAFQDKAVKQLQQVLPQIKYFKLDVQEKAAFKVYLEKEKVAAIVSCLPFFLNKKVAEVALATRIHYFDLTEDRESTTHIKRLAKKAESAFVPQCGLAPGFVNLAAHSFMQKFSSCTAAKLRVGALPQVSSNALHYSLTWSVEGLINEYKRDCEAIEEGALSVLKPLEGLEEIKIDGSAYEAFNTSGGLGNLALLYQGKIQTLNYKTLRYPGHCEKIRFLMNELRLKEDPALLKGILEKVLLKTADDLVIIYLAIQGIENEEEIEKTYFKKLYPQRFDDLSWSAIQLSTASSLCAVVDLVLTAKTTYQGFVPQEQFALEDFLSNRFGQYYA